MEVLSRTAVIKPLFAWQKKSVTSFGGVPSISLPPPSSNHSILLPLLLNLNPHLFQQLPNNSDNDPMVLLLLQPTNNHNRHDTLDPPDPNRPSAAMNRILARPLAQRILARESRLVPSHLIVHEPCALPEPQDRVALARHPAVVVGVRAGVRCRAEERVLAVREGDVDYDRVGVREQALAQQIAERPGCVGGEVWEEQRVVDAVDFVEFAWGGGGFRSSYWWCLRVLCFNWEHWLGLELDLVILSLRSDRLVIWDWEMDFIWVLLLNSKPLRSTGALGAPHASVDLLDITQAEASSAELAAPPPLRILSPMFRAPAIFSKSVRNTYFLIQKARS